MMAQIIQVGMADLRVAKAPDKLMSAGLGSCVGVCLYDKTAKLGGLAHVMLPASLQAKNVQNRAKFADTALDMLVDEMEKTGGNRARFTAKIAGGAQMFRFAGDSDIMRIGERNVQAVEENLRRHGIKLVAKDTGGNFGRTIVFDIETGDLLVKTIGHGERVI
ncbi:CheD, stimulates methylation of MCP proteins [Syntrophothermus lipocalidus DSM 12680]|uniref:Probable chemoreceptor glutamine deamidase CheD n=2 Tax=Syntrophothermus TaxID=129001 RepID=D7CM25_SYNLT|nr:CheD, stimulates methylation of MCP proteins [Syntrophothermus lipocalidus DSM 12680]